MHFKTENILLKSLQNEAINFEEALFAYTHAPTHLLTATAHKIRQNKHPKNDVSWIIDRNVNITNVCVTRCKFCNFSCSKNNKKAFVTSRDEYRKKTEELFLLGGDQLLLQGGLNPSLNLNFYCSLFSWIKSEFPNLKLHALSPTEIYYLSKTENISYSEVLRLLVDSGLNSLPGAGAEILNDRVRQIVSPAKIDSTTWLEIMHEAHKTNLVTSATMMFGHIETLSERIEHLIRIRNLQNLKPKNSIGFVSFIPWTFYSKNTALENIKNLSNPITPTEYIRLLAISRIVLNNIPNIQASWLTVGKTTAAACLYAGANDLGSIMIEENVVSSAGAKHSINAIEIQTLITDSGFVARRRNQDFTNF